MKWVDIDKGTFNTDTAYLMKRNSETEDLGGGWIRYTVRSLYYRPKPREDFFLHIEKTTVDRKSCLVDFNEYIYPVDDGYAEGFNLLTGDYSEGEDSD